MSGTKNRPTPGQRPHPRTMKKPSIAAHDHLAVTLLKQPRQPRLHPLAHRQQPHRLINPFFHRPQPVHHQPGLWSKNPRDRIAHAVLRKLTPDARKSDHHSENDNQHPRQAIRETHILRPRRTRIIPPAARRRRKPQLATARDRRHVMRVIHQNWKYKNGLNP